MATNYDPLKYATEEADSWAISASFPDEVYMLGGDDFVITNKNNVSVYGGTGNDTLRINSSYVFADGQEGNDFFELIPIFAKNATITTGEGQDGIYLRPIAANRLSTGDITTAFITDFSSEDVIFIYDTDYSEDSHAVISGRLVEGNLVISDNVSLGGGSYIENLVNIDNGSDTVESYKEINPTFSITLQGVKSLEQVNYWQGYQEVDGELIYGFHPATSANNAAVESTNLEKNGEIYNYSGGDKVINNYQQGEVVALTSDYQGIDLNGNSFFVNSSSGKLEIQNSRDKFIGYSGGDENVVAYSYVASGAGNVDGRGKSQAEIMIGGDNSNNQMYAGSGGSSLWGGNGGNDTMTGGAGYDEFFYAVGSGNDVITGVGDNDIVNLLGVNLSQITYAEVSYSDISIGFTDGGKLKLEGQAATGFRLEGVTYAANRSTGAWYTK